MTADEARTKYGPIQDGIWSDELKWCSLLVIPQDIAVSWMNTFTQGPTKRIYCNRDFQAPLLEAIQNVRDRSLMGQLKTFDGCYEVRDIRGEPGRTSAHSYGIAIDINAGSNHLGKQGDISTELIRCFTDAGLTWGGIFRRCDPMHFSLGF